VIANPAVTEYVDAAIQNLQAHDMRRCPDPDMPAAMQDPDVPNRDDWIAWRPIPSTVSEADIDDLERHFGGSLPKSYVSLLQYVHFYELTERGVRFQRHVVGKWKRSLMRLFDDYQEHFPPGSHLVPFGDESLMDAGPVCFDFKNRRADGDCPVVYWDHEWVNTEQEIGVLFSSSQKMFECLRFNATSKIDFIYHDPDYDQASDLSAKQRLLAQFLAIDPKGAGGPGRGYWTCWGVTPCTA
jgi:SMI1 / KNR4 family (SUKH-1)